MPDVTIEIEIYCGTCGAGLCRQSDTGRTTHRQIPYISVEACEHCMEVSKQSGYDEGIEAGRKESEGK